MGDEAEARQRLVHLLEYVKEVARPPTTNRAAPTTLPSGEGVVVLHEAQLRKLSELQSSRSGQPTVWLSGDGKAGIWMKFRRPNGGAHVANASALHKHACEAYAELFSLRQEALREGRGAQLVVGVGQIRGKIGKVVVDHPLVMLPADLDLDQDGALVVRSGDAAQPTLWTFPGLASAGPAVVQINKAAEDYGLVGTNQASAPTDRDRWEPLLSRAAHCLASDGRYEDGPPKKTTANGYAAHQGSLTVHNTFVLFARDIETSGDKTVSKDADALSEQLRSMAPGALPASLGRLAGVYGLPVAPATHLVDDGQSTGFGAMLLRAVSLGFLGQPTVTVPEEFLYFGLPANEQQETTVATLQRQGCCVLLGPPGTGKSQTIANVICHYLATGRRVLVTSKGEPATEVLRNKLPEGIRELAISLGGGDSGSFRRLEGAVEHLADHVAGAPAAKLKDAAERLQKRFASIQTQLQDIEAADADRASKYFPATTEDDTPLASLQLHQDNLELLGLRNKTDSTMVNLADAIVATLGTSLDPSAVSGQQLLPMRAYFLEDLTIDSETPPPSQHVLDELCTLRRSCILALKWEVELRSTAAQAQLNEQYDLQRYRELAQQMQEFARISEEIESGKLPRILCADKAEQLVKMFDDLHVVLSDLDEKRKAVSKRPASAASGRWLFQLLRHSDHLHARQIVKNICCLIKRMDELANHWSNQSGKVNIQIPHTILKIIDEPTVSPRKEELSLSYDEPERWHDIDEAVLGLGGSNKYAAEVTWQAHPETHGLLGFMHRRPSESDLVGANLRHTLFDGRTPTNPHEWQHVEQLLLLRACAARLREQWSLLQTLTTNTPDLPSNDKLATGHAGLEQIAAAINLAQYMSDNHKLTLRVCVTSMDKMKGMAALAVEALGSALECLDAATTGPAQCKFEAQKIQRSLQGHRDLCGALAERDKLFTELGNPDKASPLGKLQSAVHELGSLQASADALTQRWQLARSQLREARMSLEHCDELKCAAKAALPTSWARHFCEIRPTDPADMNSDPLNPCPRDARRLWAAIAAREAMRKDHRALAGSDSGSASAMQRLLGQRRQVVQELVVAVAKHALRETMSPETCAGLVRLVSAVAAAGAASGDSDRANRYRADLTAAMNDCASAVPCWIMPTWRIAQCLPAEIGSFDLVVLDEASQSDITALGALLRGKHVLVVGDQKQVSPTAAFISESRVRELKSGLLASHHPYVEQLLPGRSIFDLAQTCFADARVALSQHFRCVPPCIAFSNLQFYHGRLQPRRLPPASERLEPALIDVFVKNGHKKGKINEIEAAALVQYLKQELSEGSELAVRGSTVGIISLMGLEQTRVLRKKILEELTDVQLARHKIVVGDPSSFQGDERDVILLSMVASKGSTPSQTGRMYEQRFNVALSRARDRMVLFRSLKAGDVKGSGDDLKLQTLNFFSRTAASPTATPRLTNADETTAEGQLVGWLAREGFKVDASLSVAGATCVVEDYETDRRVCVCVDGSGGASLADWVASLKEQRGLERTGWSFVRLWHTNWLIDAPDVMKRVRAALHAASVRPETTCGTGTARASAAPTAIEVKGAAAKRPSGGRKRRNVSDDEKQQESDDDEERKSGSERKAKPPTPKKRQKTVKKSAPKAKPKAAKKSPAPPKAPAAARKKSAPKAQKATAKRRKKNDYVPDSEDDDY